MSRAIVTLRVEVEATPEAMVSGIDHLEEAIRLHFAPYVVVRKFFISVQNTFSDGAD